MPAYFLHSGILFGQARAAYERMVNVPSDLSFDRREAFAAVLFAAAALEAWIAELELHASEGWLALGTSGALAAWSYVMRELEPTRASIRVKFSLAKAILSGTPYDKGTRPYQDFHLLLSIRDALVHMKPERVSEGPADDQSHTEKLLRALESRGLCGPEEAGTKSSWLPRIATRAIARWACNVAADMVRSVAECLGSQIRDEVVVSMLIKPFERMPDTDAASEPKQKVEGLE